MGSAFSSPKYRAGLLKKQNQYILSYYDNNDEFDKLASYEGQNHITG